MELNATTIIGALGVLINLVWTITTLRIESRISTKIDDLKNWMEGRYVSIHACNGCHAAIVVQHTEIERRLVVLEARR